VLDKTVNFASGPLYDHCSMFKGTTKFTATWLQFGSSRVFGIKRYDFSNSTGNEVISVANEFEVSNGANPEIPYSIIGAPLDNHEDIIIIWAAETTPSYNNKIYAYQRQCDYMTQNGNHPVCFDCFSDQKITE
jgi:hypothetical protein